METNTHKIRSSYKCLFVLFHVGGIFPIFRSCSAKYKSIFQRFTTTAITVMIILTHVYLTLLSVIHYWLYQNPVANTFINLVTLAHRCVLLQKWDELKKLAYLAGSLELGGERRFKCFIFTWVLINFIFGIAFAVCDTRWMLSNGLPYAHYGISRQNHFLYNLAATLHAIYFDIIGRLPIVTMDIFYIMVCFQIRCALKNFSKTLTKTRNCDALFRWYASIKATVAFADNQMSFLMFCYTIFNSGTMYNALSLLLLHHDLKQPRLHLHVVLVLLHFTSTLVSFVIMAATAALVAEASAAVGERVREQGVMVETKCYCLCEKRFESYVKKEIYLTVWKIVPIRRSFIVGTLGAILTYVILFDNLMRK